jgi:hypothetical protein
MSEWRDIPGYEGLYQASTDGQVRSLWFKNRATDRARSVPLVLKAKINIHGYRVVVLRGREIKIGIAVLLAFVGPRPQKHQLAHNNGVSTDDRLTNLRWATAESNAADKVKHGTDARGERNKNAKLTATDVREIRACWLTIANGRQLAREFGVAESAISGIVHRRTWQHVGNEE